MFHNFFVILRTKYVYFIGVDHRGKYQERKEKQILINFIY